MSEESREPVIGVTLDSRNPQELAEFWSAVLGYELRPHPPEAEWRTIHRPNAGTGLNHMHFQPVPEGKVIKNRLHLDLFFTNADLEVQRLVSLGATVVGEPASSPYTQRNIVMQDPEGNEFCVVHRKKED